MTKTEQDQASPSYGPFVSVVSKGGPHDDESFVCGWEMGKLDAELEHRKPSLHTQLIHADNAAQTDLIAMHHGYTTTITATEPETEGWLQATFTRAATVPE